MIDVVLLTKVVYDVVLIGGVVLAFTLGGWSERIGATIAVVATGASNRTWPVYVYYGLRPRYGYSIVDTLTLFAFDALMVRSRAFWPVWATGAQLLTVALDLAIIASPEQAVAYRLVKGKLAYPILLGIILGSFRARRLRLRAAGRSPSAPGRASRL